MNDKLIGLIIAGLKDEIDRQAHDSLQFPKAEPFEHGLQAGIYQGLKLSLSIVENVLARDEEAERNFK